MGETISIRFAEKGGPRVFSLCQNGHGREYCVCQIQLYGPEARRSASKCDWWRNALQNKGSRG